MKKIRFTLKACAFLMIVLACASAARAQATRTWVSGVGDDVNPCSRTAPCKTFAGAISKTAASGEIDCLDPGGFGTVTITKNITIDGTHGAGFGGILASGTNGVNINDSATASPNTIKVRLRSLSINGAGTGLVGINYTSGKQVEVIDCMIFGFRAGNGNGIRFAPTVSAGQQLHVTDTIISDNSGAGIFASNTAVSSKVEVVLNNVTSRGNNAGLTASTNSRWIIKNSVFDDNVGTGVEVLSGNLGVDLQDCVAAGNVTGIAIAGNTVRASGCRITNNTNGVNFVGGTLVTYGDNIYDGNTNESIGGAIPAPTVKK